MPRLPDRYPGPYCAECGDRRVGCRCLGARCLAPKCGRLLSESNWEPVPISTLEWRKKLTEGPWIEVEPSWACGPACLFGFVRSRQKATKPCDQAAEAARALTLLYGAYWSARHWAKRGGALPKAHAGLLAKAQGETVMRAIEYARMASVG
jgi:hypothetical protein